MSGTKASSVAGSLAVAETPLHIFNLINLISSDSLSFETGPIDLVVYDQFSIEDSLVDRIVSTGLFRDVYKVAQYEKDLLSGRAAYYTAWRIACPKRHRSFLSDVFDRVPKRKYDYLIAGVGSVFLMDVRLYFCQESVTVFFEEGEGSYFGNFVKAAASYDKEILMRSKSKSRALYSLALRMLQGQKALFNAKELYLYRPDLVSGGLYQSTIILGRINPVSRENECLKRVFGKAEKPLEPVHACLLGNASCDRSEEELARSQEIDLIISHELCDVVFRPHPRSKECEISRFRAIDRSDSMWESRCLRGEVNDDSILIGYGSTAQTNPKKLFDFEPINVFLHRLMPGGMDMAYAELSYQTVCRLYRNKSKIHCPATLDELRVVVKRLGGEESA